MNRSQPVSALIEQAARLWGAGQRVPAKRFAVKATKADPDSVDARRLLGFIHQNEGRLDAAISTYRKALVRCRGASRVEILLQLGWCLKASERLDEARTIFESCLHTAPDTLEALVQCADIHSQQGALEQALALSRQALALPVSGDGRAQELRAMAQLSVMLSPLGPPSEHDIERLYEDMRQTSSEQAIVTSLFALGAGLERLGEYTAAFETFNAANRLQRAGRTFDMSAIERRARAYCEVFDERLLQSVGNAAVPSPALIFVVGLPRCGSTLVESMISAHPHCTALGEVPFMDASIKVVCDTAAPRTPIPESFAQLGRDDLARIAQGYLERLGSVEGTTVDKYLDNFWNLGLILALFPAAKVIDVRKNPIDACLSVFKRPFAGDLPYAYDLDDCARYLDLYEGLMAHWTRQFPDRIKPLRYEELATDPQSSGRALFEHLGLEWTAAALDLESASRVIKTGSRFQLRQAIHTNAVEHWRHYRGHLDALELRYRNRYPDLRVSSAACVPA